MRGQFAPYGRRLACDAGSLLHITMPVATLAPLLDRVSVGYGYLARRNPESLMNKLRMHAGTGRLYAGVAFVARLEALTGRRLRKRPAGRKNGK